MTCPECEKLRAELADVRSEDFRRQAHYVHDGAWKGWWATMFNRDACDLGDRLVELGLWEHGSRLSTGGEQLYRPVQKG